MATMSLLDIRADFPVLTREFDGRRIVYLDSAATSQKPNSVIEQIDSYYRRHNANVHRGVYRLAEEATELFEGARKRIAAFVNADPQTTILTRNATEAINLIAYSWGHSQLKAGDVVLITEMEHHSNIVPWQLATASRGAELRYIAVDQDGYLDLEQVDRELASGKVKLFAFTQVSNVLGTINPVVDLVQRAKAAGVTTVVDGSQAVPQMPVDVAEIGADFYVWTGHKALGPTGIGVLHGNRELLETMPPFMGGGDMIKTVDFQQSSWNELPWKFEAGTSPIAEAVGLGAAVDYLTSLGMDTVRSHEQALTEYALQRIAEIDGLDVVGPTTAHDRGGLVAFKLAGIHPHDIAELVNRENVCIRAGHHCAQPLMRRLGVPATARASFGPYNVSADIDALVGSLAKAQSVFA